MRERVLAVEGGVLLVLGTANIINGRFLGAAVLIGIASVTVACAWAMWSTNR